MFGVLHIPHASTFIPSKYLSLFCLSKEELNHELLLMTDHFTDELFASDINGFKCIKFPVSRLLDDPERFESDEDEKFSELFDIPDITIPETLDKELGNPIYSSGKFWRD